MSILIATGPHVTVNTIAGLPFIQATQTIINLSDNNADLCAINAPPFPIEYRHAMVHVPVIEEGADHPVHLTTSHQTLIQMIEHVKVYFSCTNVVVKWPFATILTDARCGGPFATILSTCVPRIVTKGHLTVVSDEDSADRHMSFGTCPGKSFLTLQASLAKSSKIEVHGFVGNPMDHYCNPGMGPNNNE
jgi:hypothetical protein